MEFEAKEYPCVVTNFDRVKKEVSNFEEHKLHALSAVKGDALAQLAVSEISPTKCITHYTWSIIDLYTHFKRYGIQFIFPEGIESVPNKTLAQLDYVAGTFDKIEHRKLEEQKSKVSSSNVPNT